MISFFFPFAYGYRYSIIWIIVWRSIFLCYDGVISCISLKKRMDKIYLRQFRIKKNDMYLMELYVWFLKKLLLLRLLVKIIMNFIFFCNYAFIFVMVVMFELGKIIMYLIFYFRFVILLFWAFQIWLLMCNLCF